MNATKNLSGTFSKVVKKHRLAKGISMLKLAEMAAVDKTYIGKLERGMRAPTLDTAGRLAKALGLPLWKLVKESESLTVLK
jgi:transcriptional regulator with XRE-family HTH domain